MSESLRSKLLQSSAFKSFDLELEVYKIFKEKGWNVNHAIYYIDSESKKFREIDVIARKFGKKKVPYEVSQGINLLIECKSIKGYNIIVGNKIDLLSTFLEDDWIGSEFSFFYEKVRNMLKLNGIQEQHILQSIKLLHNHCFPDGTSRHYDYRPEGFSLPTYTSFRETNIDVAKEIDNSVLFKAIQSLLSYLKSKERTKFEDIDYEVKHIGNIELFEDYNKKLTFLRKTLEQEANHIECYHMILVVEANLWELSNSDLNEIGYFRLLIDTHDGFEKWIDVVTRKKMNEYFDKFIHYDHFLGDLGA